MRSALAPFTFFAAALHLSSCATVGSETLVTLDSTRLAEHVRVLAADDMEGRGAGYSGERRAGNYIAAQFEEAGLAPIHGSYFQPFEFRPVGGTEAFQSLPSRNVIGYLRGASRPDEIIVIGGHYDGQGMTGQAAEGRLGERRAGDDHIWNSASDNATSVAALIEMARVLAHGPRPARSIVFVAFSGEENRLNGAFAYVRNPPLPWAQHVAMINLEKIVGHEETTFLTATQGSSPVFDTIAAAAQMETGVVAENFYAGIVSDTDHFAFNIAHLPALVIGTGAYDNIHNNSDVFETLRLDAFAPRVGYILAFLNNLANDPRQALFTADVAGYSGVAGGLATDLELQACGLTSPAFVVTDLGRGVAEHTDLRIGDVVISANDAALSFGEEGANFLEDATSARGEVSLQIACGDARRTAHITLAPAAD